VVVGAGLAGLVTALRLSPQPCLVLSGGALGEGSASSWAQGGIAAAVGGDDTPELHAADTVEAGAGLCDPYVVEQVTDAAPGAIDYLEGLGARFDRAPDGTLRPGLEGAHSRRRIVHARGDGTGREVMRAVVRAVGRTPSIRVLAGSRAQRILVHAGRVVGLQVEHDGRLRHITTERVVLATGGSGSLWPHTTNPAGSVGHGLALAARAGAELRDLEMVQFHPTALDVGLDPLPLVSEAVRGAGARLVNAAGELLTDDPLAARDVVSRLVSAALARGEGAFLDASHALGPRFAEAFPAVAQACLASGIDPSSDLLPVRPAAHYQCGGVTVDLRGRTDVPGLWAVGEVASTGLHGANRLASNSLLEAVVCAGWVADDLAAQASDHQVSPLAIAMHQDLRTERPAVRRVPELRSLVGRAVGVLRQGPELEAVEAVLRASVAAEVETADDATIAALLVTRCALLRTESRGGHARVDHPMTADVAAHTTTTLAEALTDPPGRLTPSPSPVLAGAPR